jgi:hypothetical protein
VWILRSYVFLILTYPVTILVASILLVGDLCLNGAVPIGMNSSYLSCEAFDATLTSWGLMLGRSSTLILHYMVLGIFFGFFPVAVVSIYIGERLRSDVLIVGLLMISFNVLSVFAALQLPFKVYERRDLLEGLNVLLGDMRWEYLAANAGVLVASLAVVLIFGRSHQVETGG